MQKPPCFIFYRTSSIGDVVLTSACLQFLKKSYSEAKVFWIGREPSLSLLASDHAQVIPVPTSSDLSKDGLVAEIRSSFTPLFIFDLQSNLRSLMICKALSRQLSCPRATLKKKTLRRTALVYRARIKSLIWGRTRCKSENPPGTAHLYQDMLNFVSHCLASRNLLPQNQAAGFSSTSISTDNSTAHPQLAIDLVMSHVNSKNKLGDGVWLALAPGALYPTKRAPLDYFVSICQRILNLRQKPLNFAIVGGAAETELSHDLEKALAPQARVQNFCAKLTLIETGAVLKQCRGLFGHDTALAHIAEACGTPAAVLFGPTVEAFGFAPWRPQSRAFSSSLGCRPCSKHGRTPCRYGDQLCFRQIDVEEVARFVDQMLDH